MNAYLLYRRPAGRRSSLSDQNLLGAIIASDSQAVANKLELKVIADHGVSCLLENKDGKTFWLIEPDKLNYPSQVS